MDAAIDICVFVYECQLLKFSMPKLVHQQTLIREPK